MSLMSVSSSLEKESILASLHSIQYQNSNWSTYFINVNGKDFIENGSTIVCRKSGKYRIKTIALVGWAGGIKVLVNDKEISGYDTPNASFSATWCTIRIMDLEVGDVITLSPVSRINVVNNGLLTIDRQIDKLPDSVRIYSEEKAGFVQLSGTSVSSYFYKTNSLPTAFVPLEHMPYSHRRVAYLIVGKSMDAVAGDTNIGALKANVYTTQINGKTLYIRFAAPYNDDSTSVSSSAPITMRSSSGDVTFLLLQRTQSYDYMFDAFYFNTGVNTFDKFIQIPPIIDLLSIIEKKLPN